MELIDFGLTFVFGSVGHVLALAVVVWIYGCWAFKGWHQSK